MTYLHPAYPFVAVAVPASWATDRAEKGGCRGIELLNAKALARRRER